MNGPADPSDNPPLRILLETPGNQPMVWKIPPSGLVLGSALGCDIRLPSDLPPVALMVFPVWGPAGCSAQIRSLAPLLEIIHNGREWTGESLPPGESLHLGPVTLKLLNASGQRLEAPALKPEPFAPPVPPREEQANPQPRPKKKISWLKRWQRSLEMRESTLLVSKSWGFQSPPPVPDLPHPKPEPQNQPVQQSPAIADKDLHELEEWIQSARTQADACALERDRLKKIQEEAESLNRELEISLEELRREKERYQTIQQEQMFRQEQAAKELEEARRALLRQAGLLAQERAALPSWPSPAELPPAPPVNSGEPLPSLWEALENSRVDTTSIHDPGQVPEPKFESGLDSRQEETASTENLWHQFATLNTSEVELENNIIDHRESAPEISPEISHLEQNQEPTAEEEIPETPPTPLQDFRKEEEPDFSEENTALPTDALQLPEVPPLEPSPAESVVEVQPTPEYSGMEDSTVVSLPEFQQTSTPEAAFEPEIAQESVEKENGDEEYLEDQENFLPQPDPQALEAFQQWCQSRLAAAAEQVRVDQGMDDSPTLPGDENAHRQGFARKLVEQNLTTPKSIRPLSHLSATQGIPLEDLLVRMGLFTTHQVATMGLGCASDLVLGRWFILELPAIDAMDLDREMVFRVFDPRDNANRVLRILAPSEAKKPERAQEYKERHLACSKLDSEHLLRTLEVLDLGELPCVLQEDSTGVPSENWPPLGASATVWYRLFLQAAVALRDLHEKGLVHGHLGAGDFQLQPEGLLQISGAGTPPWLAQGGPYPPPSPAQDLADLARVSHQWWTGKEGENQRYLPEPLAGILARLESGHQNSILSARSLAEELDRAGILLPSGASAWQRFLEELNGPDPAQADIPTDEEDPDGEVLRQSA